MADIHQYLQIAVKTPLRRYFDYLPPVGFPIEQIKPGSRVLLPFGKKKQTLGIVLSTSEKTDIPKNKLKRVTGILDESPVINRQHLEFLVWASRYYHYPIGVVIFQSLPAQLNIPEKLKDKRPITYWTINNNHNVDVEDLLSKTPKQLQLFLFLKKQIVPISEEDISSGFALWKRPLKALSDKALVKEIKQLDKPVAADAIHKCRIKLNKDQIKAIETIEKNSNAYNAFLLDGVTGSGKTEIYLNAIENTLINRLQVLVLLPEIGLTPQLLNRFRERFNAEIVLQHSGLSKSERYNSWLKAKTGQAAVILGTRSAIWTPLAKPGLYIVDEEHDISYKQQDTFRYSARDIALVRAKRDNVPIILGSATPSMESLQNVNAKKYQHIKLPSRAGNARPVTYDVIDLRGCKMHGAISQTLAKCIQKELDKNNQSLLFLNRRGYADHLLCHKCGHKITCQRCEYPYTYHKSRKLLICHHCESQKKAISVCEQCGQEALCVMGHGTERIEESLSTLFRDANIVRIDRDTTRRKNSMQSLLKNINDGDADIIIGTQMLAKGHHFPNITLTGIIDADRGLFGNDYRASERMAQLLVQVSGRTGRGNKKGKVLIQTHYPEHEMFQTLITRDYAAFSKMVLQERRLTSLPPFSFHAILRAEATKLSLTNDFLSDAKDKLLATEKNGIELLGPVIAPVEKRSGRYRMQLLIQSGGRKVLHKVIDPWLEYLESSSLGKKVRWSIDIDPQDIL